SWRISNAQQNELADCFSWRRRWTTHSFLKPGNSRPHKPLPARLGKTHSPDEPVSVKRTNRRRAVRTHTQRAFDVAEVSSSSFVSGFEQNRKGTGRRQEAAAKVAG